MLRAALGRLTRAAGRAASCWRACGSPRPGSWWECSWPTELTGPLYALSPMASDATGNTMREFDHAVRIDLPVLLRVRRHGACRRPRRGPGGGLARFAARLDVAAGSARAAPTLDRGHAPHLRDARRLGDRRGRRPPDRDRPRRPQLPQPRPRGVGVRDGEPTGLRRDFSERLRPEHGQRVGYVEQSLERLRALPGVVSATATTPDIVNLGRGLAGITPQGTVPPAARGYFLVNHRMVFPGYFEAFGMRIVRGRGIERTDIEGRAARGGGERDFRAAALARSGSHRPDDQARAGGRSAPGVRGGRRGRRREGHPGPDGRRRAGSRGTCPTRRTPVS